MIMTFMLAHPHDIPHLSAQALSRAIHHKQVSCREVMAATLAQIDRLNPISNAIVSREDSDTLLAQANAHDTLLARGQSMGWMHGMPQAIKDLSNAKGLRTISALP